MYHTYCIHRPTSNLTVLKSYVTLQEAITKMEADVLSFLKGYKGPEQAVESFRKIEDIEKTSVAPGYYYKISMKCPNRISVWEKRVLLRPGTFYSSQETKIEKILVFGVIDLSRADRSNTQPIPLVNLIDTTSMPMKHGHVDYLQELKEVLQRRRKALASSDSDADIRN